MSHLIEYQVRPVTRYIVTRFESNDADNSAGCCGQGEYDNADIAYDVGYALAKAEHERLGWPPGDERIQYPRRIEGENHMLIGAAGDPASQII